MIEATTLDLIVCTEELAELQQAISKHIRYNNNQDNLEEEIADVLVCIDKLITHCNLDVSHINHWLDFKLNRLKNRGDQYDYRGYYIHTTPGRGNC